MDLRGLEQTAGESFFWAGRYRDDFAVRDTLETRLGRLRRLRSSGAGGVPRLRDRLPGKHRPRAATSGAGPDRLPPAGGRRHDELLDQRRPRRPVASPLPPARAARERRGGVPALRPAGCRPGGRVDTRAGAGARRRQAGGARGPRSSPTTGRSTVPVIRWRRSWTRPGPATPSPEGSSAIWTGRWRAPGGREAPQERDGLRSGDGVVRRGGVLGRPLPATLRAGEVEARFRAVRDRRVVPAGARS